MARGLFQVYQDVPAPTPAASTSAIPSSSAASAAAASIAQRKRVHRDPSSSSTLSKTCRPSKTAFLVKCDENAQAAVHQRPGKENVDPHVAKSRLGTGKKLAVLESESTTATATSSSQGALKVFQDAPKIAKAFPKPSLNGECTGTLRTRVIPGFSSTDDEQDPSTRPIVRKSSAAQRSKPTKTGNHRPVPLDDDARPLRMNPPGLAEHSPAHDSGYAPSPASASEVDSAFKHSADLSDSDRRARALTESPLAEVTEAFTGLGRFTNRNVADRPASPSPLSTSFGNSRPIRSRLSPVKKGAQATKPYDVATSSSLLSTTRKTKSRFESSGLDELSRGVRSMRV